MTIYILFFTGLLAGIIMSKLQKGKNVDPVTDAIFGMIGALICGTIIAQFITLSIGVIILGVIGAIVFVEIGRVIPEPF